MKTLTRRLDRIVPPTKQIYLTNWGNGFAYKDKLYKTLEELLQHNPELKDYKIETSCVIWE